MNVILCSLSVVSKYSTWTLCILNYSLAVVVLLLFHFTHKEWGSIHSALLKIH